MFSWRSHKTADCLQQFTYQFKQIALSGDKLSYHTTVNTDMSNDFSTISDQNIPTALTLDKARTNTDYIITASTLNGELKDRLAELGLTTGTRIKVDKKAPLGDPLEISLRGYRLCIRASEAKYFIITRLKDD